MALASQTLILRNPSFVSPRNAFFAFAFALFSSRNSRPKTNFNFSTQPDFYKPQNLKFHPSKPYLLGCSSNYNPLPSPLTESTRPALIESTRGVPEPSTESCRHVVTESTRTVSTILASAILISKLFGHAIGNGVCKMPSPNQLLSLQGFQDNLISNTSPLFFAAIHRQQLQTPLSIIAFGLAKCIEVYMAFLAIRCALSFFPNVQWNQQPYTGLRDMCDPFLLFFQRIVPPVFDSLDISASVGFMVLTILVEILTTRPF